MRTFHHPENSISRLLKVKEERSNFPTTCPDYAAAAGGPYGGIVAYSADADTVIWSTASNGVMRSQNQAALSAVSSLPSGAVIASDKRTNAYFYAGSGATFYVSPDTGSTFSKGGGLGSATSIRDIAVHPTTAGEVWVSTDVGLFRSTNYGAAFTQVGASALTNTQQVALGRGSGTVWNVYAFGTGPAGAKLYASADLGSSWTDVQGTQGFGSIGSCRLAGSGNKAGLVYVGTNGRGVFYASGSVSGGGSTTSSTTSAKPSTTLSTSTSKTTSTTVKTTSTTSTVKTTTSSAPTATATAVAGHWSQCGGIGFTGPTVCAAGYTCQKQNDYYSQCL